LFENWDYAKTLLRVKNMIVVEHVSKFYDAFAAVTDLSFSIAQGEIVGLLGLNGAGKTTTLRILSGLLVPTSGRVQIGGLDMADNPYTIRSQIGFLPDIPPLYPEMRIKDFLMFVARVKGLRSHVKSAVQDALEATDLVAAQDELIGTLSHGFKKRVGIAQAIVHRPQLILLDEPTSGLDPVQVVQMRQLLRELRGRHTIVVSSHILGEIQQVCDRIFVMRDGRIEAEGNEAELAKKVTRNTKLRLEVRGDVLQLSTALKEINTIQHFHIDEDSAGILSASIELADDEREALAQKLITAGLGLRKFECVDAELEHIFLQLTGSEMPKEKLV
jgi:ABC-2 type transport system ATP-binding protein